MTGPNLLNVGIQAATVAILAFGQTFVIVEAGIDLSVGSVAAVSSMLVAYTGASMGLPPILTIVVGLVTGAVFGALSGIANAFLKLPSFIATLAMMSVARGLTLVISDGRPVSTSGMVNFFGSTVLGIPIPIVMMIIMGVIASVILNFTSIGRSMYAVGGNMQAARLTGIKVWLVLLFVYGMSGLLSGLGGVMSASRLYSANGNLGMGYELDAIAAVILGGTSFVGGIGTITGTLVGALIIATLNNGMTLMGVSYFWQLVIKGAVIIIAVLIDKYRTRHHQSA